MSPRLAIASLIVACAVSAPRAHAGGSPEHILLLVNPASSNSLYLGNYYKNARNIPDANVLYINPFAGNYQQFTDPNGQAEAVLGKLRNSRIDTHIDYIVVCDPSAFAIFFPNLIADQCSPVSRISVTGAYSNIYSRARILLGTGQSTEVSQYQAIAYPVVPRAFDSRALWFQGNKVTGGTAARRYFLSSQLGYNGTNGNTIPEILAMIDRSVAVDGTKPAGTIYYVDYQPDTARNVRASTFPIAVNALPGRAQIITFTSPGTALPTGQTDVLGVMTGAADPPIDTDSMVIQPGAFCDHLTSWAGTFDINQQTKMSSWIRRGASGTAGAVEEPCNYPFKFPYAIFHPYYFTGLSLGESYKRSLVYVDYQMLLQGDPMTRPFATFPSVNATPPAGPLSGTVSIPATASTTLSGAAIAGLDLFVDGVRFAQTTPGTPFSLYTGNLPDGYHELRVLAYDNTNVRNCGRWIGSITTNNAGRAATLNIPITAGTLSTSFSASYTATGAAVQEVRLLQNERVVTAGTAPSGSFSFYGRQVGPGPSRVQIEAIFADGTIARSAPISLSVDNSAGAPSGQLPIAQSYTKYIPRGGCTTIELPGVFDDAYVNVTYNVLTGPIQSTSFPQTGFITLTAPLTASGTEAFTYRITTPSGQSNVGTISLVYTPAIRSAVPQQ